MKAKSRIFIFLFSFLIANWVYGYDLNNITPVDNQHIDFSVTPEASFTEWEVTGEIKVLKDLEITFSSKDFEDSNKIVLNLKNELLPNSSYNLLSVFWVDWNIDFSLLDEMNLVDIANSENIIWIQWISRLVIIDSKTIEVYFNDPVDSSEFEFKLFRESKVESISNESGKLSINLSDKLDKSSSYLLMLISLKDISWDDLSFEEEIYDFSTDEKLSDKIEEIIEDVPEVTTPETEEIINNEDNISWNNEEIINNEENKEVISDNNTWAETWEASNGDNLNASSWEEGEVAWELEEVALNAAATPKSWPETWVLIFLTIFVNIFIFARKKILK